MVLLFVILKLGSSDPLSFYIKWISMANSSTLCSIEERKSYGFKMK